MKKITNYCNSSIVRSFAVSLLSFVFALPFTAAKADRLHFTDGESISGALLGIEAGKVKWLSVILGELEIEQHHVSLIESQSHCDLKITGRELNSCWLVVQQKKQQLHCDQGLELFHRHVMLQSFDSAEDFEISALTGFKCPINGHFSSVIQLEYDYHSLPA